MYLPVPHTSISQDVLVKHRRKLEDELMKGGMYVLNSVTLQFVKQGSVQDRRKNAQQAMLVVASEYANDGVWTSSGVWDRQLIPGIPLIKVSDMAGYDPESRPGASARVEQRLGCRSELKLFDIIVTVYILDCDGSLLSKFSFSLWNQGEVWLLLPTF